MTDEPNLNPPEPKCPKCLKPLQKVRRPSGSMLNPDQFDAIRAGDWFCECHTNGRGNTSYAYFWNRELAASPVVQSKPATLFEEVEKHRKELIFENMKAADLLNEKARKAAREICGAFEVHQPRGVRYHNTIEETVAIIIAQNMKGIFR